MKSILYCLILLTIFFNFSCQRQVESSPVAENEKVAETPQPTSTPSEDEGIDLIEKFSTADQDNPPNSLKINNYKIKKVIVKKQPDKESPITGIYDAVL